MKSKQNSSFTTVAVHAPNWVGDHVMAFPFYSVLKTIFKQSRLLLIARGWVKALLPDGVFDEVYVLEGKSISRNDALKLIDYKVDLGFTLSPSFRSALLLRQIKSTLIIGYKTDLRNFLLKPGPYKNNLPRYSIYEHRALSYLRLLTPFLDADTIAEDLLFKTVHQEKPRLQIHEAESLSQGMLLNLNSKPVTLNKNSYWVIAPGSTARSKIYPVEYHYQVINSVLNESQKGSSAIKNIVLAGSKDDAVYARHIIDLCSAEQKDLIIDLTGKTSLDQLLDLLSNSLGVTANDSGIAHMAWLTDSKLVTFIGMARRYETLTLASEKKVLMRDLDCIGCMKHDCPRNDTKNKCLLDIQPSEVTAAIKELLN